MIHSISAICGSPSYVELTSFQVPCKFFTSSAESAVDRVLQPADRHKSSRQNQPQEVRQQPSFFGRLRTPLWLIGEHVARNTLALGKQRTSVGPKASAPDMFWACVSDS